MALLIMGCGVLAQNLMLTLVSQGNKLSILDECGNPDDHIISDTRVTVFVATGNLMDDLQNCDIDNVSVFLALSEGDNNNAMASQIASHMFNVPHVVCRVDDPSKYDVYGSLGINVVSATSALANNILDDVIGAR